MVASRNYLKMILDWARGVTGIPQPPPTPYNSDFSLNPSLFTITIPPRFLLVRGGHSAARTGLPRRDEFDEVRHISLWRQRHQLVVQILGNEPGFLPTLVAHSGTTICTPITSRMPHMVRMRSAQCRWRDVSPPSIRAR